MSRFPTCNMFFFVFPRDRLLSAMPWWIRPYQRRAQGRTTNHNCFVLCNPALLCFFSQTGLRCARWCCVVIWCALLFHCHVLHSVVWIAFDRVPSSFCTMLCSAVFSWAVLALLVSELAREVRANVLFHSTCECMTGVSRHRVLFSIPNSNTHVTALDGQKEMLPTSTVRPREAVEPAALRASACHTQTPNGSHHGQQKSGSLALGHNSLSANLSITEDLGEAVKTPGETHPKWTKK